jgi:transcriptional regulator with XRE-family HTH domain
MQKKTTKNQITLGQRIRQLRRQHEWSQEDLGKKIDIHWQTIARYEKDTVIPTATVLKHMAEVFNVTTDFLIFGGSEGGLISKVNNSELLKRFEQLDRLNPENIDALLIVLDSYIRDQQLKKSYQRELEPA